VSRVKTIIETALRRGAARAEVFYLNSLQTEVNYEAGRLKELANTEETGVALRLVKDGKLGFATTTKLTQLDRLVDDALATASCGDDMEFDFAVAGGLPDFTCSDKTVAELSVDEMMKHSEAGVARLLDYEKDIQAESGTTRDMQTIHVMNSDGVDAKFERTQYQFYVHGRLIEGTNMLDGGAYFGGTALDVDFDQLYENAVNEFRRARTNVDLATGRTTVVLTPRAVADIMLTLNLGVSGAHIEQGISPLVGKLGKHIFDERITIRDDGLRPGGYRSAPFDDEGVPMQTTTVVESGVLKSYLTDLRTARKLNHADTGNGLKAKRLVGTKELGKSPTPEITNWVMEGGEKPYEELLSDVGSGVLVDSIMGLLMSNLIAGEFGGNLAYGLRIEDGKTTGRVKDAMISGNIYKLFKSNIIALSKDVELTGLLGGIGTHWYPYVILKDVTIATKS